MRNYRSAIECLNGLQTNAAVLNALRKAGPRMNSQSLPEMRRYLAAIGYSDQDVNGLNIVHVSGTKGKGSTCAMTESILRHCAHPQHENRRVRTGLFTSPHLIQVRERIRIDGAPISQQSFSRYFYEVYDRLHASNPQSMPTYFRFLTLMAIHVFIKERVDVAIMEVGIGGTYDSTNIVTHPVVCGISSLGYDHMAILGNTLPEIASHKAGIMKQGCPAITVQQPTDEAMEVIRKHSQDVDCALMCVDQLPSQVSEVGLSGDHQKLNAALATALAQTWLERMSGSNHSYGHANSSAYADRVRSLQISSDILNGLREARWPGRAQVLKDDGNSLTFYMDGAHTAESLSACSKWFSKAIENDKQAGTRVLVFNCTMGRDPQQLLSPLIYLHKEVLKFDRVCFVSNNVFSKDDGETDGDSSDDRYADLVNNMTDKKEQLDNLNALKACWTSASLQSKEHDCRIDIYPSIKNLINTLRSDCKDQTPVLVTGSLHLVGGVLAYLGKDVQ
ncbi:hypothetical protein MP228_006121 [Amoeboaphelidium protococcarum]|nr:hypothetical protein MP228_006121 [Amoeboaphelidium protococcarum]